jgi:hypothetical protein
MLCKDTSHVQYEQQTMYVTLRFTILFSISVSQTFDNRGPLNRAVGAHAGHLRKVPHSQKCKQVNRKDAMPFAKVTITTFFLYTNLKLFLK